MSVNLVEHEQLATRDEGRGDDGPAVERAGLWRRAPRNRHEGRLAVRAAARRQLLNRLERDARGRRHRPYAAELADRAPLLHEQARAAPHRRHRLGLHRQRGPAREAIAVHRDDLDLRPAERTDHDAPPVRCRRDVLEAGEALNAIGVDLRHGAVLIAAVAAVLMGALVLGPPLWAKVSPLLIRH